jgi:UDP-GlcNAc3NAcA epimerase
MSDVFFKEMKIPKPDHFLEIGGLSHGSMVGQMIEKIELVLISEEPDWVLIYGDTNSTLAGAIAASKLNIKIAHIEAGLRSFNMRMAEEINRILSDRVSSILFCPTQTAVENLIAEGANEWNATINLSGDVMLDGANFYKNISSEPDGLKIKKDFILSTIHRAENTDSEKKLTSIIEALNAVSKHTPIILPLHPRTRLKIKEANIELTPSVNVIEPVGYLDMMWLIKNCNMVMTDSGGLQKEAFFLMKHCITLREETEWTELVTNNFNILVGSDKNKIITAFKDHIFSNNFDCNLYGNGNAANLIINELISYEI